MAVTEERLRTLEMVEEGVITAGEGAALLAALEDPGPGRGRPRSSGALPRGFRVRVTDLESGTTKVNVSIPMGIMDVGLKLGARFGTSIESSALYEIAEAVRQGVRGKIFEAEDTKDGERVEIYVE
ncbi:MAG TPA: hypothetical protein VM537_28580 [Anaerolineae bacterium]|nr:hypothetical protein [Anaerolineae bacterium]